MGYWKEKEKYEKKNESSSENWRNKIMEEQEKTCSNCKSKNKEIVAQCNGFHFNTGFLAGFRLCKDCAKKCEKCEKYFCPKHIDKHNCKK